MHQQNGLLKSLQAFSRIATSAEQKREEKGDKY